jgi:hypothetical protein
MDAKEFIRELVRMCKSQDEICSDCQIFQCAGCPLIVPENVDADKLVEIVEKWSTEHPLVTNGQKVKELLPEVAVFNTNSTTYVTIDIPYYWWDAEYKGM